MHNYRFPLKVVWHDVEHISNDELPESYIEDIQKEMVEQYCTSVNDIVDTINSKLHDWNREYAELCPDGLPIEQGTAGWYKYSEFLLIKYNEVVTEYNLAHTDEYEKNFQIFVFLVDGDPVLGIRCAYLREKWLHVQIDVEAAQKQIDEMKKKENENGN